MRYLLIILAVLWIAAPVGGGDCSDPSFAGSTCYPADNVAIDVTGSTKDLQTAFDDGDLGGSTVTTVADLESEAATATSKTITIPSGTYLASDHHGTATASGGSFNGAGGNGEFTFDVGDVGSVVVGDYILVIETGAGPPAGEFCKIAATDDGDPTTTFDCDRELSTAPLGTTEVEFVDPIRLIPTTDDPVFIDCKGGFGSDAGSEGSIIVEFDRSIHFLNCEFIGADNSEVDIAAIQLNSNSAGKSVFLNPSTQNLNDIEATGTVHGYIQGDRFLVTSGAVVDTTIIGGQIDATLSWHFMNTVDTFSVSSTTHWGTSSAEDGLEYGCLYQGDYLNTWLSGGVFKIDGRYDYCRWFHWWNNPTIEMGGTWYWPSYIYSHDHPDTESLIISDGGRYSFDNLTLEHDTAYTDFDLATPVGLAGDTPPTNDTLATGTVYFLRMEDRGGDEDLFVSGAVFDSGCVIARQATDTKNRGFLFGGPGTWDALPLSVQLDFIEGDACRELTDGVSATYFGALGSQMAADLETAGEGRIRIATATKRMECIDGDPPYDSTKDCDLDGGAIFDYGRPRIGDDGFTAATPSFSDPTITGALDVSAVTVFDTGTTFTFGDGAAASMIYTFAVSGTSTSMQFANNAIKFFSPVVFGYLNAPTISPTGVADFGTGGTLEIPNGTDPAATCTVGQIYMDTDTASDTNCTTTFNGALCRCAVTNTWTGE